MTVAHMCCFNGHYGILKKALEKCPHLAQERDGQGNLPLHILCKNTISKK